MLIVTFILSNRDNFYGPNNMRVLSEDKIATKVSSLTCKIYGFLVSQLLINYPWIVLEDLPSIGSRLLSIMLVSLRHKNLGVSETAVEFSYNFAGQVSKLPVSAELQEVLLQYYLEACKVVLKRAQRSKLATTVLSVEEGKDDEDTNDDEEEENPEHERTTFANYRKGCRQFFATVYSTFCQLRGNEGTSMFFKLIDELLKPGEDLPDNNNRLEMALFAVGSSIPSMIDRCYEAYLQRILEFVCNIDDRYNPNVRVECYRLLANCSKEISSNKELFRKVVEFQVGSISKGQVGLEAVQSFTTVMQETKAHEEYKLLDHLMEYYKTSFSAITNETIIDKFLTGLVNFIMCCVSLEMRERYLVSMLSIVGHRIQECILMEQACIPVRLSELNIVFIQLDEIQNSKSPNVQLANTMVVPFVNSMQEPIRVVLQLCVENKAKFESGETTIWSRSLKTVLTMYNIMLDALLKVAPQSLNTSFVAIMECSLKLFLEDPLSNSHMVHMLAICLDQHSRRNLENPHLTSFLSANYPQFNNYFVSVCTSLSDPDVYRQFFQLQLSVLNYSGSVFWSYPAVGTLYDLALQCLSRINEMHMQKSIMLFLEKLVTQGLARTQQFNISPLLKVVFEIIPQLNAVTFMPFANILAQTRGCFADPLQLVVLSVLQETASFGKLEEPRLALLSRAVDLFAQLGDLRNLKATFISMANIATSSSNEVDIWTALEIKVESTNMVLKRQQRLGKK